MLNYVVKISMMSAKYFEYYTIMLRGAVFSWTRWTVCDMRISSEASECSSTRATGHVSTPALVGWTVSMFGTPRRLGSAVPNATDHPRTWPLANVQLYLILSIVKPDIEYNFRRCRYCLSV